MNGHFTTAANINNKWYNISDDYIYEINNIQNVKGVSLLVYNRLQNTTDLLNNNSTNPLNQSFSIHNNSIESQSKEPTKNDIVATLRSDGGSRRNPGHAGAGAFITIRNQQYKLYQYMEHATNNEAEYIGLLLGLRKVNQLNIKYINIILDSKLICGQINNTTKCINKNLQQLKELVMIELKGHCTKITHQLRKNNKVADSLANKAMDLKSSNHDIDIKDALTIITKNKSSSNNIPIQILNPKKFKYDRVLCPICSKEYASNYLNRHIEKCKREVHNIITPLIPPSTTTTTKANIT